MKIHRFVENKIKKHNLPVEENRRGSSPVDDATWAAEAAATVRTSVGVPAKQAVVPLAPLLGCPPARRSRPDKTVHRPSLRSCQSWSRSACPRWSASSTGAGGGQGGLVNPVADCCLASLETGSTCSASAPANLGNERSSLIVADRSRFLFSFYVEVFFGKRVQDCREFHKKRIFLITCLYNFISN